MADVFISYHEKTEGAIAAEIASKLESKGITCWYAKRDVPPGGDFTHEVITQIEECKVFLLLLDDGAAHSPHVPNEVANAFGHKKIMPYQTDKTNVKNVEWVRYYLKHIQIHSLPDYDTLTAEIASALGRPVETITPKPQPVQPVPETVRPKPQPAEPVPETVKPEPQPAKSKLPPKKITLLDGFLIAVTLICNIGGGIVGFILGRQTGGVAFFSHMLDTIDLSNSSSGFLGAATGCSFGWIVSEIIIKIKKPKVPYGADSLCPAEYLQVGFGIILLIIYFMPKIHGVLR